MGKRQKQQASRGFSRNRVIAIGAIAALVAGIGIAGYNALIPSNGTAPVLGIAANHFIKAIHTSKGGYLYVSQSSGAVKGLRGSGGGSGAANPTYTFAKNDLQSIHFINEDIETHSKHNFNIDAFNVHTRDLGYFESQTVTFLPDKTGTFEYYCTIHPEMKGNIVIE
ncbi:cupredoxin domain-containing protein [Nitrososphaera sp.]|uniref:cupredoxin domain-containing protein n=1 Tax=Nitrososphaera sp. TaxID=1971748 RepID=UPI00307D3847